MGANGLEAECKRQTKEVEESGKMDECVVFVAERKGSL